MSLSPSYVNTVHDCLYMQQARTFLFSSAECQQHVELLEDFVLVGIINICNPTPTSTITQPTDSTISPTSPSTPSNLTSDIINNNTVPNMVELPFPYNLCTENDLMDDMLAVTSTLIMEKEADRVTNMRKIVVNVLKNLNNIEEHTVEHRNVMYTMLADLEIAEIRYDMIESYVARMLDIISETQDLMAEREY